MGRRNRKDEERKKGLRILAASQGCVETGDEGAGCPGGGVRVARFSLEGRARARALLSRENKASWWKSKLPGFKSWLCHLLAEGLCLRQPQFPLM